MRLLDSARREVVRAAPELRGGRTAASATTLDRALRRAAARGVKVRLLISDWQAGGPRMADLQSLSRCRTSKRRLSIVPEWSGGYIPFARVDHCKYVVVDSLWTWVGTSNWDPGYFHRSRNVAVTMRNRPLAIEARKVFESGWSSPGAIVVRADTTYAPKVHGMTPPPGKKAYGS